MAQAIWFTCPKREAHGHSTVNWLLKEDSDHPATLNNASVLLRVLSLARDSRHAAFSTKLRYILIVATEYSCMMIPI